MTTHTKLFAQIFQLASRCRCWSLRERYMANAMGGGDTAHRCVDVARCAWCACLPKSQALATERSRPVCCTPVWTCKLRYVRSSASPVRPRQALTNNNNNKKKPLGRISVGSLKPPLSPGTISNSTFGDTLRDGEKSECVPSVPLHAAVLGLGGARAANGVLRLNKEAR